MPSIQPLESAACDPGVSDQDDPTDRNQLGQSHYSAEVQEETKSHNNLTQLPFVEPCEEEIEGFVQEQSLDVNENVADEVLQVGEHACSGLEETTIALHEMEDPVFLREEGHEEEEAEMIRLQKVSGFTLPRKPSARSIFGR